MASDDRKTKTSPVPKAEAVAPKKAADATKSESNKTESTKTESTKTELAKSESTKANAPKAESGETGAASPKSYSRGEGQKPVSQAYKDNWNAIFAKKKKKR